MSLATGFWWSTPWPLCCPWSPPGGLVPVPEGLRGPPIASSERRSPPPSRCRRKWARVSSVSALVFHLQSARPTAHRKLPGHCKSHDLRRSSDYPALRPAANSDIAAHSCSRPFVAAKPTMPELLDILVHQKNPRTTSCSLSCSSDLSAPSHVRCHLEVSE